MVKRCQLVFVSFRKRNDKLVQLNFEGYARMALDKAVPPALLKIRGRRLPNPDYFAVAYPCCEVYSFYECERDEDGLARLTEDGAAIFGSDPWLTEEKIDAIKDIPIWNCWLSMFENVKGTDDPNAFYIGHFSWVYLLNDQVTGVQNREAVRNSEDLELFGTTPSNEGGGASKAGEYSNIFDWMNLQSKQ